MRFDEIQDGQYRYQIDAMVVHSVQAKHMLPRRTPPQHIVVHWTGAENPPRRVAKTLEGRGLSVDFIVAENGTIFQCNPMLTDLRTQHCGRLNPTSIGIEVVCAGRPSVFAKVERPVYYGKVHGRTREFLDFWPEQKKAVWELIKLLTDVFPSIPRQVPVEVLSGAVDEVPPGIVGHYGITKRKLDPGPGVMAWLREQCFERDPGSYC